MKAFLNFCHQSDDLSYSFFLNPREHLGNGKTVKCIPLVVALEIKKIWIFYIKCFFRWLELDFFLYLFKSQCILHG